MEWAASVHDDVAVPGLGSVGMLWCLILVPVSGKVCVNVDIKGGASWLEDQAFISCCLEIAA